MNTVKIILAIVDQFKWKLYHTDVKSDFLDEEFLEEVYMEEAPKHVEKSKEHLVCWFKKALHGIKQAPRAWYKNIERYFLKIRFVRSLIDSNLYIKVRDEKFVTFLVLYVYDLMITYNNIIMISNLKRDI